MTRWEVNPRERLAQAALDLFAERGYDRTTVADIAERAGLTKSTFFRHFDDKREVVSAGQEAMVDSIRQSIAASSDDAPALVHVSSMLSGLASHFPVHLRGQVTARAVLVRAHPELHERELLKRAQLTAVITAALLSRGFDEVAARVAAAIGLLALDLAHERWTAPTADGDFGDLLHTALKDVLDRGVSLAVRPAPAVTERPGTHRDDLDQRR